MMWDSLTALSRNIGKLSLIICRETHQKIGKRRNTYNLTTFPNNSTLKALSKVLVEKKHSDLRPIPSVCPSVAISVLWRRVSICLMRICQEILRPSWALFFSNLSPEDVAKTRRWSSSRPIRPRVRLTSIMKMTSTSTVVTTHAPRKDAASQNKERADGNEVPKFRRTFLRPVAAGTVPEWTNDWGRERSPRKQND